MTNVYVCVGSSCHLKGSYDIINKLKALIAEQGCSKTVSLNASFCLGKCAEGVAVKIGETVHTGVTPENVETFFAERILNSV